MHLNHCGAYTEDGEEKHISGPGRDPRNISTSSSGYCQHDLQAGSESESHSVMSDSLQPHRPYSPWNSPGQNTAVGSLSLLQGVFQTQESNQGPLHGRQILYPLSHQGSPQPTSSAAKGPSVLGKLEDAHCLPAMTPVP